MKTFTVDAFTTHPFAGNPAAVCLLPEFLPDELLQKVAAEMNLSETAFLVQNSEGYDLRWFTPAIEVDLCGHATLASAHVLWETGMLERNATARFSTRSGELKAQLTEEGIELNFPAQPPVAAEAPAGLLESLDVSALFVGYNGSDYLVEVTDAATVHVLAPDFRRMKEVTMRGVIVTSRSEDASLDFISRFFAPAAGIDEDPVTGSAHCCLGPYWAEKLGKREMQARQVSPRGGSIGVRVAGDRVYLTGQAVTVLVGEMNIGQ